MFARSTITDKPSVIHRFDTGHRMECGAIINKPKLNDNISKLKHAGENILLVRCKNCFAEAH
jgi:hypothetical protein